MRINNPCNLLVNDLLIRCKAWVVVQTMKLTYYTVAVGHNLRALC